jgi:hypothetical protein
MFNRRSESWLKVAALALAVLLAAGCENAPRTPVVIYITATPAPVAVLPTSTPDAIQTALFGPTFAETAPVTFRPLPTSTRTVAPPPPPSLTPTFTPEFTDTPPPRAATAGPARACAIRMQPNGFTTIYERDRTIQAALGCPQSGPVAISSATLAFENGQMLWASAFADQPRKVIYALFNNGGYGRFDDTWFDGADAVDTGESAPPGKAAPMRGFGKVWKNNPAARSLGWAIGAENGTTGQIQRFDRGEMLYVAALSQTFIFVDGRWRADGTQF